MTANLPDDQTLFSEEQPFFDVDELDRRNESKSGKKIQKKQLFIIVIIGVVLLLIGSLTLMRLLTSDNPMTPIETSPSPSPQASLSPLDVLFQELDQDISNADPSTNLLPFPPVADTITVSPENR